MHLGHAHQLGAVLTQALLHQRHAGAITEHVARGAQKGQQSAADVWGGGHQQQVIAAHAVQDHLGGAQDAGTDAHQANAAALAELFEHPQFRLEVIEIHGNSAHAVFFGEFFDGLEEVPAGDHRSIACVLEHALELFHRHHFHGHIDVGLEFFCDQHRSANVFSWGAHEHSGAAAQAPIDFTGEQFSGLLQGATRVEQAIHALAHLSIEIGDATIADMGRRSDFPWLLLIADVDPRTCHRFHHPIGFELAVHLADGVAMQAGLHRQLPRTRKTMPRRVVPGGDSETDLVVELGRCRYVAFLLDVESHAGGPD